MSSINRTIRLRRGDSSVTPLPTKNFVTGEPIVDFHTKSLHIGKDGELVKISDVLVFPTIIEFPSVGLVGKLYIDQETDSLYHWDGTTYQQLTGGGTGESTPPAPTDFIDLTDTPVSYVGNSNKFVTVKTDETGLEFAEIAIPVIDDTSIHSTKIWSSLKVTDELTKKADIGHTHPEIQTHNHENKDILDKISQSGDETFFDLSDFSQKGHDHGSEYAPLVHNHDGRYAPTEHSHETEYAAKSSEHTHHNRNTLDRIVQSGDETSFDLSQLELKGHTHDEYALSDHNHDERYASKTSEHSHSNQEEIDRLSIVDGKVYIDGNPQKVEVAPSTLPKFNTASELPTEAKDGDLVIVLDTDQIYVATSDLPVSDLMPRMTNYTTLDDKGDAVTVTSSGEVNQLWKAFQAFDNATTSGWMCNRNFGWIQVEFQYSKKVSMYTLQPHTNGGTLDPDNLMPQQFKLLGSNDGVNYDILDERTETDWIEGEKRTFHVVKPQPYKFYKIDVSTNNGGQYLRIGEIEFLPLGWQPLNSDSENQVEINDYNVGLDHVWSSQKTSEEIGKKAESDHTHSELHTHDNHPILQKITQSGMETTIDLSQIEHANRNVLNKLTQSGAEASIDVSRITHANRPVLDGLSEINGSLCYNGKEIGKNSDPNVVGSMKIYPTYSDLSYMDQEGEVVGVKEDRSTHMFIGGTEDLVPQMTTYSVNGFKVSASSEYDANFPAWKTFNNPATYSTSQAWASSLAQPYYPQWLEVEFPEKKAVNKFKMRPRNSSGAQTNMLKDFELQGYNEETASWETIQVYQATGWSLAELREFQVDQPRSYKRIRFFILTNNSPSGTSGFVSIGQIELFEKAYVKTNKPLKLVTKTTLANTVSQDFATVDTDPIYQVQIKTTNGYRNLKDSDNIAHEHIEASNVIRVTNNSGASVNLKVIIQ